MTTISIVHNPRCSKSRQTLQLLQDKGHQPQVIEYLKDPLSSQQIQHYIELLGFDSARQLMRHKEQQYKQLNLADTDLSEQQLIDAMAKHPKLIERPIVIANGKARLGRPPEQVLDII